MDSSYIRTVRWWRLSHARNKEANYNEATTMHIKSVLERAILLLGGLFASSQIYALSACESVCTSNSCGTRCLVYYNPGEPDLATCKDYYRYFAGGTYNKYQITEGNQVCELDKDLKFSGVKIDFMVEDKYVVKCNSDLVSYKQREVSDLSCYPWSIWPGSKCETKVANRFAQLAAQGIAPHPNPDNPFANWCPTLR